MTGPVDEHPAEQPETVDQAREQIDRTREELGETVHALAVKADVKAQLRQKVADARTRIGEKATSLGTRISEQSPEGDSIAGLKQLRAKLETVVRKNPPAALLTVLFAGLLIGRKSKRKRPTSKRR